MLVQIKKRKIEGRTFSKTNEGKVKIKTPSGWRWAEDGDFLVEVEPDVFIAIPEEALEYLTQNEPQA